MLQRRRHVVSSISTPCSSANGGVGTHNIPTPLGHPADRLQGWRIASRAISPSPGTMGIPDVRIPSVHLLTGVAAALPARPCSVSSRPSPSPSLSNHIFHKLSPISMLVFRARISYVEIHECDVGAGICRLYYSMTSRKAEFPQSSYLDLDIPRRVIKHISHRPFIRIKNLAESALSSSALLCFHGS